MNFIIRIGIIVLLPFFLQKEETFPTSPVVEETLNYCNPRYHFCVAYPGTTLSDKLVSDNGDGVILSPDFGDLLVTVSGSWDVSGKDSWELYDDFVEDRLEKNMDSSVKYVIVRENYYEVAYSMNDRYYYQKLLNPGGKHIVLQIEVPKEQYHTIKEMRENIVITTD